MAWNPVIPNSLRACETAPVQELPSDFFEVLAVCQGLNFPFALDVSVLILVLFPDLDFELTILSSHFSKVVISPSAPNAPSIAPFAHSGKR